MGLYLFLLFEVCVGAYWPASGVVRASVIPESMRATVMSLYRIPLNAIVLLALFKVDTMTESVIFIACCLLLCVAVGCLLWLEKLGEQADKEEQSV